MSSNLSTHAKKPSRSMHGCNRRKMSHGEARREGQRNSPEVVLWLHARVPAHLHTHGHVNTHTHSHSHAHYPQLFIPPILKSQALVCPFGAPEPANHLPTAASCTSPSAPPLHPRAAHTSTVIVTHHPHPH